MDEDRDRHVRRTGDDYATQFLTLLPRGQAWPKAVGSTLERACNGLSQYWGFVDGRAADLLERESDPQLTTDVSLESLASSDTCNDISLGTKAFLINEENVDYHGGQRVRLIALDENGLAVENTWIDAVVEKYSDGSLAILPNAIKGTGTWCKWSVIGNPGERDGLLPEWERAWGLPDECFVTVPNRNLLLLLKMRWLGNQSRAYFIDLLEKLGYPGVVIKEFSPFMAGISQVGDTRTPPPDSPITAQNYRWYIGPPEQRFVWSVSIYQLRLEWFRAGSSQAGVHHHLEFAFPDEVICLLEKWKPAHTVIVPDYSSVTTGGPMQGTP